MRRLLLVLSLAVLFAACENDAYDAGDGALSYMRADFVPAGYSVFLTALLVYQNPPEKITVVMEENDSREKVLSRLPFYADIKILLKEEGEYRLLNHRTTYYVCRNFTCLPPSNQEPISL